MSASLSVSPGYPERTDSLPRRLRPRKVSPFVMSDLWHRPPENYLSPYLLPNRYLFRVPSLFSSPNDSDFLRTRRLSCFFLLNVVRTVFTAFLTRDISFFLILPFFVVALPKRSSCFLLTPFKDPSCRDFIRVLPCT